MDRNELMKLADRIEQADGPCRELDAEIARAVGWHEKHFPGVGSLWVGPGDRNIPGPCLRYTSSINAAMTLAKSAMLTCLSDIAGDGLPGACFVTDTSTSPVVEYWGFCFDGRNATREQKLAQALVAAALRSLADGGDDEKQG